MSDVTERGLASQMAMRKTRRAASKRYRTVSVDGRTSRNANVDVATARMGSIAHSMGDVRPSDFRQP